jgi:hypothetical protein
MHQIKANEPPAYLMKRSIQKKGSGSTFAWQILTAVVKRARGENSTTLPVIKGHYLDRMIKDHKLAVNSGSKQFPCLVAT